MPPPTSPYYQVQDTPTSGRGCFATQLIPTGTHLLSSSDLVYNIVFREYRREVCNWCFRYDQGDILAVRENPAALVWCSQECKDEWLRDTGTHGLEAFTAVEELAKKQAKGGQRQDLARPANPQPSSDNDKNGDTDTSPTVEQIEAAWQVAEEEARILVQARTCDGRLTKAQRRVLNNALNRNIESILANHAISGVLAASKRTGGGDEQWTTVEELYASSRPYISIEQLDDHISTYHHLLALLPLPLLPFCTPQVLMTTINRDAHNSFGIRSLDDDACEMFGYGTWPSASYWNHSCAPNISKRRVGRTWTFESSRDIQVGEELCITYLGGEEKELDLGQRRDTLWKAWKFVCGCTRCKVEGGKEE